MQRPEAWIKEPSKGFIFAHCHSLRHPYFPHPYFPHTSHLVTVTQVSEPLIALDVAGRLEIRAMRAIFAAHELVSATTDAAKASLQKLVLQRSTELYDMQHALLYGSHNFSALMWPDTPATLFMSQDPANYFFLATGVCYDVERPDLYCFTKMSDMYHMVSRVLIKNTACTGGQLCNEPHAQPAV